MCHSICQKVTLLSPNLPLLLCNEQSVCWLIQAVQYCSCLAVLSFTLSLSCSRSLTRLPLLRCFLSLTLLHIKKIVWPSVDYNLRLSKVWPERNMNTLSLPGSMPVLWYCYTHCLRDCIGLNKTFSIYFLARGLDIVPVSSASYVMCETILSLSPDSIPSSSWRSHLLRFSPKGLLVGVWLHITLWATGWPLVISSLNGPRFYLWFSRITILSPGFIKVSGGMALEIFLFLHERSTQSVWEVELKCI